MRSAKAPTISAGVMQAKVIWKHDEDELGDDHAGGEGLDDGGRRHAGQERLARSRRRSCCTGRRVKARL